jgi:hypothetical protein
VWRDLVANFCKNSAPIHPALIDLVNESFAAQGDQLAVDGAEVAAYYKQDAQLWSAPTSPRVKPIRFLHRLIGKEYPYILPEKISAEAGDPASIVLTTAACSPAD